MGSIIGLLIGFAMMLMVSSHYHFLANRYPGTGGLYNYVKCIFGYDRAFLIAWFMFLIYISIFWANATSIPLFARYFLQAVFKKGYLFTVFGYEVYLGEALVTLAVMWLVGLLCMKSKKATARSMVVMVLIFTVGITVCFAVAMSGHSRSGMTMSPAFLPDKACCDRSCASPLSRPGLLSDLKPCPIRLRNISSSTAICSGSLSFP